MSRLNWDMKVLLEHDIVHMQVIVIDRLELVMAFWGSLVTNGQSDVGHKFLHPRNQILICPVGLQNGQNGMSHACQKIVLGIA